jgi:antitoxin component HigA of HigAB toxin-antitoxin module
MLCAEQRAFWQEQRAAVKNYRAAIHDLVALVDQSAENPAFNRAHIRIKVTLTLCHVARAALEHHEAEHGCQISN